MRGEPLPNSEIILYQTEDGRTSIEKKDANTRAGGECRMTN